MSSYWKKKLDELEQSKAKTPAKTTSSDYWGSKLTELQSEKKNIAPVKTTMADVSNRIIGADKNDLNSIKLEVSDLEEKSNRAKELSKRISEIKYSIQASKYGSGRNGWNYTKVKEKEDNEKLALAEAEYNNYLAEIGYKSLDELKGAYTEKKAYYKKAKYDQEGAKLATVSNEADFSQITGKGLAKDIEFGEKKRKRNYGKAKGTRGSIDKYYAAKMALDERYGSLEEGTGKYENQVSFYRNMTDEEFKIFEYHLIKDEKNGTSNAKKYIDKIEQDLEVRKAKKKYDETADKSKIAKVIYSGEVGLDQFASGMENVFNTEDEYIPVSSTQLLGSMYREDLGEHGAQLSENLGGASTWQMAYDIGQTTSNMVPSILASAAVGTISKTAGAALGATLIGTSAAGNSYQEMLNNGYDKEQARTYSTLVGVAEAGLSYALGGISKLGGTITGKGISKAVSGITNGFLRYSAELGMHAVSEGFEEAAQEALAPVFENIALGYKKNTLEDTNWSQIAYSALLGGITGGLIEGVTGGKTNAALTENEQKVVDKVYEAELAKEEADGKKLTSKEKKKLYDTVLNDLEKGYISTDTIEEVLGGEDYTAYKNTLESEEALQKEFDELNKMKQGEMTGEQLDRRAELKEQLADLKETSNKDTLKSQLNDNVFEIVKDSKLAESYAEKSRRGQAFEADLSQYEEKYQGTIKKAVESGILNNTRRTHEMVDFVAKISADKGVLFDFTDNEKIKNSSYAVDGKTVNGFVNENGDVVLNINSAKSLNSTAGHEITHILEGTELYDTLAQTITDYAKSKGDYQGRIEALNKLYEGVYKGEDFADKVNKELVADLVGDYIFTDKDFVRKLSTENRNIFEKIYDEIKYLCKVATAGSKEARELEKVKKTFAEVYRESGKAKDTKYSISDKHITDNSTGYADGETYYTMSYKQDGKVVGTLEYGEYEGQPNVKMIEVIPEYRRKGIGTKLLQELQKKYADQEIDFGMATPDGTKLIDSVTYDVTDEKVVADRKKLKDLQTELNELQEKLDILYDTENLTEAQEAEMHKLGDRWEEVYQSINKLEPTLRGKRATKTFVKTDAKYSLSAEQETYFKDSKVRDENGNLKVMYHGTSGGGFTVFDTYGSNYGLFGQGSYFTDNKSIAESYTKKGKGENKQVYESYLNITNPMDMDGQADAEAWAKQFPDALFPESGTNEDFYRAMEDYLADEMYSKWEAAEIAIDGIQGMGYDGITHIGGGRVNKNSPRHRVYIAFEPEQIKNIDNVKPTNNPDIRYSLSEADNTYLSAVEKGDMETAQKMVDEAASEWSNGNDIYIVDEETGEAQFKFYRSYDGGRTVWNTHGNNQNQGVFLTSDEYIADAFDNSMGVPHGQTSGKHITVYAKAKNPFEIDAEGQIYTSIPVYEDSSPDWLYEMSISDIEWSDEENDYISVDSVDIDRLYPEAFKRGYDAVIVKNVKEGVGGGTATDVVLKDGGTQMKSADPVTYDDNGNVIPLSQRFNTENEDIRFSLSEPVEETKDLIAVHNLQSSELAKTLELGGLPMPSIAVVKAQQSHEDYGDVSLIFPKETIDPKKNRANKVYGGDAWTPTYPRIEYKVNEKTQKAIRNKINSLIPYDVQRGLGFLALDYDNMTNDLNRHNGDVGEAYENNYAMQYAFLVDNGFDEQLPTAEKHLDESGRFGNSLIVDVAQKLGDAEVIRLDNEFSYQDNAAIDKLREMANESFKSKYAGNGMLLKALRSKPFYNDTNFGFAQADSIIRAAYKYVQNGFEQTVDYKKATDVIKGAVDETAYKKWLNDLFADVVEKEGIYNGKDIFTPSGNRRSWDALHWENTLENVVKAMKSQDQTGADAFAPTSALFAVANKKYGSIDDIKADSHRLGKVSEEDYEAFKKSYGNRLVEIADSITDQNENNRFYAMDNAAELIVDAVRNYKTKYAMLRYMKQYNNRVTESTVDDIFSLVSDIANMPTGYFEAKPQRAVGLEEVGIFVIPNNADVKLKQELLEKGYSIAEYDPNVEGDRQKVVNQFEEYKFSLSEQGETPKQYGNFNIYGKDVALKKPIAPVKETVTESALPENYAPVTEDEANATARESLETLTDADAPPETDSAYDELPDTTPLDDKALKSIADTLKDTLYLNDKEAQAIQDVVQRYSTAEFPSEEELFDEIKTEFGEKVWTEQNEEIAEVKKLLHKYRINVSPQIKNDIADYAYFHRHHFGKIRFAKDGIPVDTAYQELSEMYPQFFPADITNPTDQLWQIAEVTEMATDTEMSDMLDDETIQEAVAIISAEVGKYKESVTMAEAEQSASEYLKQIAPLKKPKAEKAYEAIKPRKTVAPVATDTTDGKVYGDKLIRVDNGKARPNEKQRKWVKTATESEAVDRKVLPDDLDQNSIHYKPISNKVTLGKANARLDGMGYESSVTYFESQFANKKIQLEDIALGERLIQEAIKRGDTKTAGELIQEVSILGTELGQKVQALSIIKRLTPEGQLSMLQKVVERGKNKGDKAFEGVELTQEMIDKILSAYNKDGTYDQTKLNESVEDVKQKLADQMKVTAFDQLNAWRYLSMLGNPKTHIRNLVSNVAMRGTVAVKNVFARTIEDIAPIKNRTKTWKRATQDVKTFAQKTALEMKDILSDGGKYSEAASIKEKRRIFKNKILNAMYKGNSNSLTKEDWWFSKPAFINSLSEYLTANGIKTEQDIINNPYVVEEAKQYATEQSQIATFRQYSWLANKINEIENKNAATNIAVSSILPFKKTPINIAKTGLSYSPLGFAKTLTYDVKQVKDGKMEASELIDHLSQNVTGTALTLVGYLLASSGFLSGGGEDDKEGKYDYNLGEQAYSINIDGKSYSLSWLSPVSMPLFVGANAYEQLVEGQEWNGDVVVQTLAQTLDPLSEMSFLSGLDTVLSSYDSGIEKFAGIGQSMAQNYVTQFAPTLLSQVATAMDDTKRSTKVAGDSGFKFFDETINKLKFKIPYLRQTLEPSTDIWGNDIKQTENTLTRAFESFIAPYAVRKNTATAIDEEIKRLYSETGDNGLIPNIPQNYVDYKDEKYKMSAEDYTAFKKTYGQTAYNLMRDLFETQTYQTAAGADRADMVNKVYDYARDEAKRELLAKKGVDYTNAQKDGKEYYKENLIKGAIRYDMPVEEYGFSVEYPEKYTFFKENGISYEDYANADKDGKEAYTWAFNNPDKFAMSKAITNDIVTYRNYVSDLYDIKADKDASGDTIIGTGKAKKVEYINNLDLDYGQKIILFKSLYEADDTYNYEIIEYLNNRDDISYDDMVAILKELGFTVKSDGSIYWD